MALNANESRAAEEAVVTKKLTANEIPMIDVSPLIAGSPAGELEVAKQLATAFRHIGFCYIKGHGVPQGVIDRAFAALPAFFDQPESEKEKVRCNSNQRGWVGMNRTKHVYGRKPNVAESFLMGLDLPADDPDRKAGIPFHDTNYWPAGLPKFRESVEAYWRELAKLGPKMMRALALSIGQTADHFAPMYKKPDSLLRCSMYPAVKGPFDGSFGSGPHTDYGTLTILAQDDVGGLQIQALSGEWFDALSIPGAFIINAGDMVARMTNGEFKSTPHRVMCGPRRRYSLPFFYFPDYSARIEVLPQFTSSKRPASFEPVIWGEYVLGKFKKTYDHLAESKHS